MSDEPQKPFVHGFPPPTRQSRGRSADKAGSAPLTSTLGLRGTSISSPTMKFSPIGKIKIDPFFLVGLVFAVLLPAAAYRQTTDAFDLYVHGISTGGVVQESHYETHTHRQGFTTSTTTSLSYSVKYLESHTKSFYASVEKKPPEKYSQVPLFYSSRNPGLVIIDKGESKSFLGLLNTNGGGWFLVFALIATPLAWAYVVASIRLFANDLKKLKDQNQ